MDAVDAVIVLTTVADAAAASALSRDLVANRLAACVQRLPIVSSYRWNDQVEEATEVLLLVKTTRARVAAVEKHVLEASTYEVAEVVVVPITAGAPAYLAWLVSACANATETS